MTLRDKAALLARLMGRDVLEARALSAESRNAVARVTLDGGERAILKFYDPETDAHAANRFRREEKVLTLLKAATPPVAPRALAGFLPAAGPAMLLMEDAGDASLADALIADDGGATWEHAARFLQTLHATMGRHEGPLRATAMAIDLDRITEETLARRFQIASERLTGTACDPGVLIDHAAFVAPLLAAPRAMIHNSMSPLNVARGADGMRAIDWETLTWASPLWDWAELLRAPYGPRPLDESETTVAGLLPGGDTIEMYRRAVLCRHLDSLATVALRRRQYDAEGRRDRAAEYARRADFYAADLEMLLERVAMPPRLAECVRRMMGARTKG